jgi:hypothetical protein
MAGSRHGTADWHFATGHFGRKRAIRRRGRGAGGGGGAPAAGTGRVSGTAEEVRAEEVRAEEERAEEEHRPLARVYRRRRGCTGGDAGVPAAKRRGDSRKGKTPADGTGPADRAAEEELRLRAQGGSAERQRRCTGRWHKAGRRNSRGGAGGRGGVPAASARRVSGTAEKVRTEEEHRPMARRAAAQKKACAAAGPYPEVRTTLFIIGSVRRGYALQRRESSCRPT